MNVVDAEMERGMLNVGGEGVGGERSRDIASRHGGIASEDRLLGKQRSSH